MVRSDSERQIDVKVKSVLLNIREGTQTIHSGARFLKIPYTTIKSRIYRGASVTEAFTTPIQKRKRGQMLGNAAWQELSNKEPSNA